MLLDITPPIGTPWWGWLVAVANAIIPSLVSGLYPASAEVGTDGKIACRNNHTAAVASIRGAGSYASS